MKTFAVASFVSIVWSLATVAGLFNLAVSDSVDVPSGHLAVHVFSYIVTGQVGVVGNDEPLERI